MMALANRYQSRRIIWIECFGIQVVDMQRTCAILTEKERVNALTVASQNLLANDVPFVAVVDTLAHPESHSELYTYRQRYES